MLSKECQKPKFQEINTEKIPSQGEGIRTKKTLKETNETLKIGVLKKPKDLETYPRNLIVSENGLKRR